MALCGHTPKGGNFRKLLLAIFALRVIPEEDALLSDLLKANFVTTDVNGRAQKEELEVFEDSPLIKSAGKK